VRGLTVGTRADSKGGIAAATDQLTKRTITEVTMTRNDGRQEDVGVYSDVHWRRTMLACYRTLLLLAVATIALTSMV
jgi:hypothetical protein